MSNRLLTGGRGRRAGRVAAGRDRGNPPRPSTPAHGAERLEPRRLLSAGLPQSGSASVSIIQSTSDLVEDAAGNLYGTISMGGPGGKGTVFELPAGSRTLTTLASFNGPNGNGPSTLVFDPAGNLFGTTALDGPGGGGTVFELAAGTHAPSTVATFDAANGSGPDNLVVDAAGNLFGTTISGGSGGGGTVFEVAAGSKTVTDLASFSSSSADGSPGLTDGSSPSALVIDSAGDLFGANAVGGPGGGGTLFEVAAGTRAFSILASFYAGGPSGANGLSPSSLTIDAAGNLYGATGGLGLGAEQAGVLFEVPADTRAFTILATLDGSTGSVRQYNRLLRDAAGNLFAVTSAAAVIELPAGSQTISPLTTISPTAGDVHESLLLDATGSLYLATLGGGPAGTGTTFLPVPLASPLPPPASTPPRATTLLDTTAFTGVFAADAAGNVYGTTNHTATGGEDAVFELAAGSRALTTLATFASADGAGPENLVIDAAGNLFGATESGGAGGQGTVFELAAGTHAPTTLASFNGTNGSGSKGLLLDAAGNLFGSTTTGGTAGKGTLFELPAAANAGAHALTTLASFDGTNGDAPESLIIDQGGNLFGATRAGGAQDDGTVFELPAGSGAVTTLATFNGANGKDPNSLLSDSAGNLYGTAGLGGPQDGGLVFELSADTHALSTLASFGTNGFLPVGLQRDAAGNLFGATFLGGPANAGTVFEIAAPGNTRVTLAAFGGADGTKPISLLIDPAGNLYGTTFRRTDNGVQSLNGTLFQVKHRPVTVSASVSAPGVTAPAATATVTAAFAAPAGIDLTSIVAGALTVTSPGGSSLAVTAVSLSASSGAPASVTATYTVAAPGGQWSAADDGAYQVALAPGAVLDAAGGTNAAATGGFTVSVTPPNVDAAFGAGGAVGVGFTVEATAVQADGKVLLAGHQPGPGTSTVAVLERLNADGSVDTSFGAAGTVTDSTTPDEALYGLAVQPDGSIVVCNTNGGVLEVIRYTAGGALDLTFNHRGRYGIRFTVANDATGYAVGYAVALDPSNRVVVAGSVGGKFVISRLTPAGGLDPTFNGAQALLFGTPGAGNVLGKVAVAVDGSILAAGSSAGNVVAVRVTAAGALDPSFGSGGVATVTALAAPSLSFNTYDRAVGLAMDAAGNVLLANHTAAGDFGVVRLKPSGGLDPAFGAAGLATTDFGGADDVDELTVLPGGTLVASGTSVGVSAAAGAVAAYTPAGALDPTFADGGKEAFDTGLTGAAPAGTAAPSDRRGGVRPAAENIGEIVQQVFASAGRDGLVVGVSRQGDGAAATIRRLKTVSSGGAAGELQPAVATRLPAQLIAGSKLPGGKAVVSFTNTTGATLSGRFTVLLYLAPAGSTTPAAPLGSTVSKVLRLKPGARRSITVQVPSVPRAPAGAYDVVAAVTTPDGRNNLGHAPAPVTVGPAVVKLDLTAAAAGPARAAKAATLSLTLTDSGNQRTIGSGVVTITSAAQTLAAVRLRASVKPAATKRLRIRFTAPAAGTYPLTITLSGLGQAADATATAMLIVS